MTQLKLIRSLVHPLVKHLVKLRTHKRYRQAQGRLVICPSKIVRELPQGVKIHTILASEAPLLEELARGECYKTTPEVLKKISGLSSPCDLVAEVELPKPQSLRQARRLLVLDNLADPGNLGTLMRTALAFEWDGLFFVEGTVDLFNDKVVRAARGAHFHLPYQVGTKEELFTLLESEGITPIVADLQGEAIDRVEKKERLALILSSEAHGPDPSVISRAHRVTVPMSDAMESLNVSSAGAILLFSFRLLGS